jgi:dihydrofolate reductase
MILSLIVAMSQNRVIGQEGKLPWYLPADLKRFRQLTTGHSVIMGRKTFQSILARLGKPLPDRKNIILTRNHDFSAPGCLLVTSLNEALQAAEGEEVFVIGGAQIYDLALPQVQRLYLTLLQTDLKGDTYFPELTAAEWKQISRENFPADEKNPFPYSFILYERLNPEGVGQNTA